MSKDLLVDDLDSDLVSEFETLRNELAIVTKPYESPSSHPSTIHVNKIVNVPAQLMPKAPHLCVQDLIV